MINKIKNKALFILSTIFAIFPLSLFSQRGQGGSGQGYGMGGMRGMRNTWGRFKGWFMFSGIIKWSLIILIVLGIAFLAIMLYKKMQKK
jgi:hypothetical protein